jgi:hypothetical protein
VQLSPVAGRDDSGTKRRQIAREGSMAPVRTPEEPLAVAARSESRLVLALRRIGIALGPGASQPYADLDALGEPVVVLGPLDARLADRLSEVVEAAGELARVVRDATPDPLAGDA